jgi:hypothetical protein
MGATDEHRIGLKPLLRRIWAPIGQRPIASVQHRCAWRFLVGFVQPAAGRTFFHLATTVSIPVFAVELAACARQAGASPTKQLVLVLVLERAGWKPTSVKLRVPDHVHLLFLPPYSPELQPAEHLAPRAADHCGAGQPALCHHRGRGGCAVRALCRAPTAARSHPLDHLLPLVAEADPQTSGAQTELISALFFAASPARS